MSHRKIVIPSIYTRDSSISSNRSRFNGSVSSVSTMRSEQQPAAAPARAAPPAPAPIQTQPPAQRQPQPQAQAPAAAPPAPAQAAAPAPAPAPVAVPEIGVLLLVIAGAPNANLKSWLQTALAKAPSIVEITVLGEKKNETTLKQLKVELYGLAGGMKRELGIRVDFLQDALSEEELRRHLDSVMEHKANGSDGRRKELHGVLCDLDEGEVQPVDVLEVESAVLMGQWMRSVGFVHIIARCTIPLLRVAAHRAAQAVPTPERALKCPFFVTTLSSSSANSTSMHNTALRTFLDSLSTVGNREITFGSADVLLAPEPEPEPAVPVVREHQPVVAPINGWKDDSDDFSAGESPTKLWGMWSMQQDLGNF